MKENKISLDLFEIDEKQYETLNWKGTFEEYIEKTKANPLIVGSAFKRLYEAILSFGTENDEDFGKKIIKYKAFTDPAVSMQLMDLGVAEDDTIFGLDLPIMKLMTILQGAALMQGPHKRLILLVGPVGAAKSTIVRRIKKIFEYFSKTDKGATYTHTWHSAGDEKIKKIIGAESKICPIHEQPFNLISQENQIKIIKYIGEENNIALMNLCPFCQKVLAEGLKVYNGKWSELIKNHIEINRFVLSEKDRMGIGTFQPKDEKNQDSTELTGDVNYRALPIYGVDSDPRAFCFDGEFCIANRGIVEFIEILKLDTAFLYGLLAVSQEHKVKPKKFPQIDLDEIVIGHTNEPEYKKLRQNEFMEALKDRTIQTDIPYVKTLREEIKIYTKKFNLEKIKKRGQHIAPHTLEIASMWAVLTRLTEAAKANITLIQKLKLYDGKGLPGFTKDNVKELLKEGKQAGEGKSGISSRYVEDKISNSLVDPEAHNCVNPFKVLNELKGGLPYNSLITSEDQRKKYEELTKVAEEEFEVIVKEEVQEAISTDAESLKKLCQNYLDNLKAYTQKEKVKNAYTGKDEEPNEKLMRSIEEKIDVPESRKDDFRREIMNYIGALSLSGKPFDYQSNERLLKALKLKLFEDQKDTMRRFSLVLTSGSGMVDKETKEKLDVVTSRLKEKFGYCDICAVDVLNYVADIFARGDIKETAKK